MPDTGCSLADSNPHNPITALSRPVLRAFGGFDATTGISGWIKGFVPADVGKIWKGAVMNEAIKAFADKLAKDFCISDDFIAASDHPYGCRCDTCKKWWADMGTEWKWNGGDDGDEENQENWKATYGPFAEAEINAFRKETGDE